MNLLLVEAHEVSGDRARIDGERARHLREILGAAVGRRYRAGVVDGPLGDAVITRLDGDAIELELALGAEVPPPSGVELVLAVPRPKTLAKLLPDVVSMGVDRIVFLRTWKVEKPYLESPLLTPAGARPALLLGAMQGRTTRLPEVVLEPLFRPWIEDRAPALFAGAEVRWVLHPHAARRTADQGALAAGTRAVVAIGPEAGFVDFEVERFAAAGFTAVSMGARPLRVEVATVAALAQLQLWRDLGGERDVGRRGGA